MGSLTSRADANVLDFGCGVGDIVQAAREYGLNAFGVEKFYGGSNIKDAVRERGLLDKTVFALDADGRIPFDDGHFDLVVSNQVFEHVEDLEKVLDEIARVLRPGGHLFCSFPSKGVLREVHCDIPIVHWLPKKTRLRYYWLLLFRGMGFGSHKKNKKKSEWASDMADWLNRYTYYRSRKEVKQLLGRHFGDYRSMEDDYVSFRLERKGLMRSAAAVTKPIISIAVREACRRYGGLVLRVTRLDHAAS